MARKPSEASHAKQDSGDDNLNLSPIMALMVILIPMLLAMFNFFEVKVQAVAAPKLGSGKTTKSDDDKKPLNLTIMVSKSGFALKVQDELQTDPEKPIPKDTFTIKTDTGSQTIEDYDYPTLYTRLMAKKRGYPDETTVNIAAEMDVPWHVVARTIDAGRIQLQQAAFTGPNRMQEYSNAKPQMQASKRDINEDGKVDDKDQEPVDMFPRVVFVVAE